MRALDPSYLEKYLNSTIPSAARRVPEVLFLQCLEQCMVHSKHQINAESMKWSQLLSSSHSHGMTFCHACDQSCRFYLANRNRALLCSLGDQVQNLCHQRGEAALLVSSLPHPSPWNSIKWAPYTASPLSPGLCSLSFPKEPWELQLLDPRVCSMASTQEAWQPPDARG